MKQIVICGAGFGGLSCALQLSKIMPDADITLVDQSAYHSLHAFLYEVASSDEEITRMTDMASSVSIPISQVIDGTKIRFVQEKVVSIDSKDKTIQLEHSNLSFDYVVLALGSSTNYYGIPGAEQYSIGLKTLHDALSIRNKVQFLVEEGRLSSKRNKIRMVIAGGGFAGVELAAELSGFLDFLSWKNNYPRELLELLIVEGSPQIMPGLPAQVALDTFQRLDDLRVQVQTKSLITNVTDSFIEFNTGEKIHYNALFWTAGVKAATVPIVPELLLDRGGRIQTTEHFQAQRGQSIFVIGDQCCFIGTDGKPLPGTAAQAIDQGEYVAWAILAISKNQKPAPYRCKDFGYVIPLGGKWGIAITPHLYIKGILAIVGRKFYWFLYLRKLLGSWSAVKLLWFQSKLYSKND